MNYVDVDVARSLPGVRLVLTVGFPGPWGQAVKKMLELQVDRVRARRATRGAGEFGAA